MQKIPQLQEVVGVFSSYNTVIGLKLSVCREVCKGEDNISSQAGKTNATFELFVLRGNTCCIPPIEVNLHNSFLQPFQGRRFIKQLCISTYYDTCLSFLKHVFAKLFSF